MENKRGLSAVVATLMIILLVFASVAIIWVVIKNVVQGGAGDIDYKVKCLDTSVEITKSEYDSLSTSYSIRVEMKTGSEKISGAKLVFTDDENDFSQTISKPAELSVLESITFTIAQEELANFVSPALPKEVKVVPFFTSENGKDQLCPDSGESAEIEIILTPAI